MFECPLGNDSIALSIFDYWVLAPAPAPALAINNEASSQGGRCVTYLITGADFTDVKHDVLESNAYGLIIFRNDRFTNRQKMRSQSSDRFL